MRSVSKLGAAPPARLGSVARPPARSGFVARPLGRSIAADLFHPAVPIIYFATALVLAMAAMQPVFVALSLAGALAFGASVGGVRSLARSCAWAAAVAVVAAANLAFVSSGSTELFRIGTRAFYGEALAYGACAGSMLACVVTLLRNATFALDSDKLLSVLGGAAPTVALMASMTARLVPQLVRRGRGISAVQRACTAARPQTGVRENLRLSTVLMGWAMEDSLETADAMRARSWGAAEKRTSYARYRFRAADALACVLVAVLAVSSGVVAWVAVSQFMYYPRIAGFAPWPSYAPYALFVVLPTVVECACRRRSDD